MISALFGLPGAGKSLCLGYIAYRAVNGKSINFHGFNISTTKYARVYTNFPCEGAYKLDFELLGKADYNNCLMLIDEIQLFADSRNFKSFGDNLKWFFSLHRKMHIDILYCSQSFDNVDRRIRTLTDRLYYIDKWLFGTIRIRGIMSYFDVSHGNINEGYSYCSGFNTKYFFAKRLYKYNDTYHRIKELPLIAAPSDKWSDDLGDKALGDTLTPDGKAITIYSDDTVSEVANN